MFHCLSAPRVILREPERNDRPWRVILRKPERSDRPSRVILRKPERSDRPWRVILRKPERSDRRPKDRSPSRQFYQPWRESDPSSLRSSG